MMNWVLSRSMMLKTFWMTMWNVTRFVLILSIWLHLVAIRIIAWKYICISSILINASSSLSVYMSWYLSTGIIGVFLTYNRNFMIFCSKKFPCRRTLMSSVMLKSFTIHYRWTRGRHLKILLQLCLLVLLR